MYNVIDISQWQGRIDWETVKGHIDGAIIRCGWGSDYVSQDDTYYEYNCSECERLGIPYGVYLYSYATSEYGARSEAAHALRLIEGKRLSLPVYFDSEESGTEYAAKICAETFCDILREHGHTPGVYASLSWWNSNLRGIDDVSKWCACWGSGSPGMTCDIWQYTSNGSVPGINGRVDMNECYIEFDDFKRSDYPMEFIMHPDQSGKLFYVCGNSISYIPNEDALAAVDKVAGKIDFSLPHIELGTPDAPWGFRFFEACGQADLYHEIVDGVKPVQSAPASGVTVEQIAKMFIELGKSLVGE